MMSRYIGFKLEPGQQIPKWYFSLARPEDPHICIEIKTLWSTVACDVDPYIILNIKEGRIQSVNIVTSNEDIKEDLIYLRLFDLIRDKTGDLPTQPLDDE